jgi:hypothetical protein
MNNKFSLVASLCLAVFVDISASACSPVGCEPTDIDILPSPNGKFMLISAGRICGSGMVTTFDDLLYLTPTSEFDRKNLNPDDYVMIFGGGWGPSKPKSNWSGDDKIEVILPPSEISPDYPDYPNQMRKSLHGITVVIKNEK